MSKKIEKVIDSCTDCGYAKEFRHTGNLAGFVLVCIKTRGKEIVLASSNQSMSELINVVIPANCPLEDYQGKNFDSSENN